MNCEFELNFEEYLLSFPAYFAFLYRIKMTNSANRSTRSSKQEKNKEDEIEVVGFDQVTPADEVTKRLENRLLELKRGVVSTRGRGRGRPGMPVRMPNRRPEGAKKRRVELSDHDDEDEIRHDFIDEINKLGAKLKSLEEDVKTLKGRLDVMNGENRKLASIVGCSKDKFEEQKSLVDDIDKKSRLLQFVITSPIFSSIEKNNFRREVKDTISTALRLSTSFLDRFVYRRIGNDGRKIFVTALDEYDKSALFVAARTLRPQDFYVNEHLTKTNAELFFHLRKMKKDGVFASVYSYRGDLYVKKDRDSRSICVKNLNDAKNVKNGLIKVNVPVTVHTPRTVGTEN